jgi:hypothetical protein
MAPRLSIPEQKSNDNQEQPRICRSLLSGGVWIELARPGREDLPSGFEAAANLESGVSAKPCGFRGISPDAV